MTRTKYCFVCCLMVCCIFALQVAPTNAESLLKAIDATVDPVKACDILYECIQRLTSQLVGLLGQNKGINIYNLLELYTNIINIIMLTIYGFTSKILIL